MKLALKFAISFLIVTVLVWGTASYVRLKREISLFEHDVRRDHESTGIDLAAAVADIWSLGGEKAARDFVDKANESKSHVLIGLLPIDSVALSSAMQNAGEPVPSLNTLASHPIGVLYEDSSGTEWVYTYISVPGIEGSGLAVELIESLAEKDRYISSTIQRAVLYTMIMGVLAGVVAMTLGLMFIARPVRVLMAKARRVANGDLRGDVHLGQRDELGELGNELNAMSARLAEARHRIAVESAARETTVEQLRHADRLTTVGKLAASVAHELGTPLNIIKARARMIAEREVEGDSAISSSRTIAEQSERMSRTIRGLLDLSRRDAPNKEQVDLRLVATQALGLIETMARKNDVSVSIKTGTTPVFAVADSDQIRQVLMNLMMNAVEAMPNGGQMTVDVRSDRTDFAAAADKSEIPGTIISVSDTGTGISPESMGRLFDPFFSTKDRETGTGLGLSISADMVREHGGRIEVKSKLGEGSTFSVHLPVGMKRRRETD